MDLVYLVAYGKHRFRWAAELAARSLREFGGFAGEIVIFTDRPGPRRAGFEWRVVRDERALARGNWMKHGARAHLDLPRYDRVAFIDSDILTRSPITPLWDRVDDRRLVVTDDLDHTVGQGHCYRALTAEERARFGDTMPGINSGFVLGRGAVMDAALTVWAEIHEASAAMPGPGYDQPALNAAVVRERIAVDLVPGLMWFPGRDRTAAHASGDAPFVHYHGIGRHLNRYWRMRRHYRRLQREH